MTDPDRAHAEDIAQGPDPDTDPGPDLDDDDHAEAARLQAAADAGVQGDWALHDDDTDDGAHLTPAERRRR